VFVLSIEGLGCIVGSALGFRQRAQVPLGAQRYT